MPSNIARLSRVILTLALATASLAVSAQIHRCKDEHGQTVLSDRPCGADAARQDAPKGATGGASDRISAPQMVSVRMRDTAGQYDFISDRGARPMLPPQQGK
jgi:hypothetical protein